MAQKNERPAQLAQRSPQGRQDLKIYPMLPSEYILRHGTELFLMGHRLPKEIRGLPVFRDYMPELPSPRTGQISRGGSGLRDDNSDGQQETSTSPPQLGSMQAMKRSLSALEQLNARLSRHYGKARAFPMQNTYLWKPIPIQTSQTLRHTLNIEAHKGPQQACIKPGWNPHAEGEQHSTPRANSQGEGTGENSLGSQVGSDQKDVNQNRKAEDEEEKDEQKQSNAESVPSHDGSDSDKVEDDDQTPAQQDVFANDTSEEAPATAPQQQTAQADADVQDDIFLGLRKTMVVNQRSGRQVQCLTCVTCQRTFSKLCNATDHVRTHNNIKPYECVHCSKTFTQQGNRDRHMVKSVCARRHQNH